MAENLVIVESPAKAKTIEKFLGEGYTVKSSFGHIRDLSKKNLGINIEKGFEPDYLISDDKKKVVSELKSLASKSGVVWLASDEDREGEAIAWHLQEALKLNPNSTKRIVFHEITKEAILHAIENPRQVDLNLVMAQQARRIMDRLVGFELSPILWKKVGPKLSAGRVQSVAVKLIVEREREILNFNSTSSYKVEAIFTPENTKSEVPAELNKRFDNYSNALAFLNKCISSNFKIADIEEKDGKKSPSAPFTTSTLQQEASRKLGYSLSQTMRIAQSLYEAGHITYMRTDSTNLSSLAIGAAKSVVSDLYGKEYSKTRQYSTKTKGAQEAHEAIRPTYLNKQEIEGTAQEKRLYKLIWKRTVASQMSDAIIKKTEIKIASDSFSELFNASAQRVVFDGFLKLYTESSDDDNSDEAALSKLPKLTIGETMNRVSVTATQKFSQRPPRYTEASLVKKLEELGIGRPSTYAPTISTIIARGYVVKEDREGFTRSIKLISLFGNNISEKEEQEVFGTEKGKLFPQEIGIVVNDFLTGNFESIVDYGFTAKVEEDFDKIAEGKLVWRDVISSFYSPFHDKVESALKVDRPTKSGRIIGMDPDTGREVVVRMGRFGPYVQIGENDDPSKRIAGLAKGQLIESITMEDALKLFKLPRVVGKYEDSEITAAIGRFGPYIKHGSGFISLGKDFSPYTIDLEQSILLIEANKNKNSNKIVKSFPEIDAEVLNGRYGAYIKSKGENYKIPKEYKAEELDSSTIIDIISKSETKKKKR